MIKFSYNVDSVIVAGNPWNQEAPEVPEAPNGVGLALVSFSLQGNLGQGESIKMNLTLKLLLRSTHPIAVQTQPFVLCEYQLDLKVLVERFVI
jgi:hypothetical protein